MYITFCKFHIALFFAYSAFLFTIITECVVMKLCFMLTMFVPFFVI